MARVVLITGGNSGDRHHLLREAQRLIEARIGNVVAASQHYESAPWGFEAEHSFLNQVLEVESVLEPEALLEAIHEVEQLLGRDREAESEEKLARGQRYASRTMDVDILFYDDRIIQSERLTIPHPHIEEREFVLRPLNELMPDRRHPLTGKRVDEMLNQLKNKK